MPRQPGIHPFIRKVELERARRAIGSATYLLVHERHVLPSKDLGHEGAAFTQHMRRNVQCL